MADDLDNGQHDEPERGRVRDLVTGTAGTLAGIGGVAVAGPFGALIGPATSQALDALIDHALFVRRRGAERTLAMAAEVGGVEPSVFVERAHASDRHAQLIAAAVSAGSLTDIEEKVAALAESLVTGALSNDEAIIERERIAIDTIAQLERAHLWLLRLVASEDEELIIVGPRPKWTLDGIKIRAPELAAMAAPAMSTLQRLALVEVDGTDWRAAIEAERRDADRLRQEDQRRQDAERRQQGREYPTVPSVPQSGPRRRAPVTSSSAPWRPTIQTEPEGWIVTPWGLEVLERLAPPEPA